MEYIEMRQKSQVWTSEQKMIKVKMTTGNVHSFKPKLVCVAFIPLFFVFSGCNRVTIVDVVGGVWLIEQVDHSEIDFVDRVGISSILLRQDKTCDVPFLDEEDLNWTFDDSEKGNYRLIFSRSEDGFSLELKVVYSINENRILQMEMYSDSYYVLGSRMLFYPQNHPEIVDRLIKGSTP